jgi:transposase-like protein
VKAFAAKYGKAFPAACGALAKDLADCLTFERFPQEHWRRIAEASRAAAERIGVSVLDRYLEAA